MSDVLPRLTRDTRFSARSQANILIWGLAFAAVYFVVLVWLLNMLPPPDADMTADQVAQWYRDQDTQIKVGAVIASYTSGFLVPIWMVIAIQVTRQEQGWPIWGLMTAAGGAMMSIFLALPPIFFGVAAFTPDRNPEVTQLMHELGCLTLITTDQYFIFSWVAVAVLCFRPPTASHSPFPRWFGYMSIWCATMLEGGAIAYMVKSGLFSWNGLIPLWIPVASFGIWMSAAVLLLLKSLKAQRLDALD